MPRGFSESEMNSIKETLLVEGETLFTQYGFAKTTVEDICKRVSISKGTFYKLFESKDTLLFEIICVLNSEFQEQVTEEILAKKLSPRERLKGLLQIQVKAYNNHPILIQLLKPETFSPGVLKLSDQQRKTMKSQSNMRRKLIFNDILGTETLSLKEPEQIASVFRALLYIYQNKGDMPVDDVEPIIAFFTEAITNQLIKE